MLLLPIIHHLFGLYDFLFLGFLRFLFYITKHHCYWNEFRYPSHDRHRQIAELKGK